MVIYLIVGTTSLYSWNVAAYKDEHKASEHIEVANKAVTDPDIIYMIQKVVVQ